MTKPTHFTIAELVDPWFLSNYSEDECWEKLDPTLFPALDWLRDKFGPLRINGGGFKESGLRRPNTMTGATLSAHKTGQAYDIKPLTKGVTVQSVYDYIMANQAEAYSHGIREVEDIRDTPTWCHISSREVVKLEWKIRVIRP